MPHIGYFTQEKAGEYVSADPNLLQNSFKEWINGIMFSLATPRITEFFIGKVTDNTMHNDLQTCNQIQCDKVSRSWDN